MIKNHGPIKGHGFYMSLYTYRSFNHYLTK